MIKCDSIKSIAKDGLTQTKKQFKEKDENDSVLNDQTGDSWASVLTLFIFVVSKSLSILASLAIPPPNANVSASLKGSANSKNPIPFCQQLWQLLPMWKLITPKPVYKPHPWWVIKSSLAKSHWSKGWLEFLIALAKCIRQHECQVAAT